MMGSERYDLEAESARVRYELVTFRDACLPALLGGAGGRQGVSHLQWWTATKRLIVALPTKSHVGPFQPEWFEFLPEEPEPGYEVRNGSIVWQCKVGLYPFADVAVSAAQTGDRHGSE